MLASDSAHSIGERLYASDLEALLPMVAAESVPVINHLSQSRDLPALILAGMHVQIEISCLDFAAADMVAVPFSVGDKCALIELQPSFVSMLTTAIGYSGTLADEAPLQRSILIELALLDIIGQMETVLGEPIRILTAPDEVSDAPLLGLGILLRFEDGSESQCRLRLPQALSGRLATELRTRIPAQRLDLSFLPIVIRLEAGRQTLSLAEIKSLVPGDIVMLDRILERAVVAETLAASVKRVEAGFQLDAPLTRLKTLEIESTRMADTNEESVLDDIPVKLVFEFGRIEMELGEVRALQGGSILPLSRPMDEAIDIVVNGRRIGRGSLVKIGDGLGVRILRIAADE